MKNKEKKIIVGCDLDGIIAKHSLGGLWVKVRLLKEKLLKKAGNRKYYYPKTVLEKYAWIVINYLRVPDKEGIKVLSELVREGVTFYLVTSRLRFNYPSTINWLKKYKLYDFFSKILVNIQDENPVNFKLQTVNKEKIDYFIDDDLEVLQSLCQTQAKLYWVVPGHRNGSDNKNGGITVCESFKDALLKMKKDFSLNTP